MTPVFIRETIALIGQRDQRSQRETRLAMIGGGQHACLTTVTLGHCECQGAWLLMVAILTAATVEGEQKSIYENDANAVLHSVRQRWHVVNQKYSQTPFVVVCELVELALLVLLIMLLLSNPHCCCF